jgi:hypothetical protein
MTRVSHRFSRLSLPLILAVCVVTGCSNPDRASVHMPTATTTPLACPGGPPPVQDSLITESPATGFTTYLEPPLPSLLEAGATAVDPTFGTTILRLTDGADGNTDMQVQYSYWPVFNGNCTFIHVVGTYEGVSRSLFFPFDPATSIAGPSFKLELPPPQGFLLDRSDMIWSGTSPDHIYGHNEVHRLWSFNVMSHQYASWPK